MHKRMMLLVAPLCVVAVAASVVFAAPSGAEHASDAKLDELHAERPIAAPRVLDPAAAGDLEVARFTADVNQFVAAITLQQYLQQLDLQAYLGAVATFAPSQSWHGSAASGGDFLSCVRNRESGGDYGIYNSGGSGAAGAYQFLPGTWSSIAASVGRMDLVGVDPAQASPADQDAMAAALYAQQGAAPWGGGC
jgi:hypothetical protein